MLLGGAVERVDRARLPEGVRAAEERRSVARDRVRQVLELEPVRVRPARRRRPPSRRPARSRSSPPQSTRHGRRTHEHAPVADDLEQLALRAPGTTPRTGRRRRPGSASSRRAPCRSRSRRRPARRARRPARRPTQARRRSRSSSRRPSARRRRASGSARTFERSSSAKRERRPDERSAPDRALADELARSSRVCGWWRYMNASIRTSPARVGGVEGLLDLGRAARVGLLAEDVLARGERVHRPLVVHAVRERDVDGVDVGVGEERLVRAVGARDAVLARVGLARPAGRGSPTATTSTRSVSAAPREDLAVDVGGRSRRSEPHCVLIRLQWSQSRIERAVASVAAPRRPPAQSGSGSTVSRDAHAGGDRLVHVGEHAAGDAAEQRGAVRRALLDDAVALEREAEHRGDDLEPERGCARRRPRRAPDSARRRRARAGARASRAARRRRPRAPRGRARRGRGGARGPTNAPRASGSACGVRSPAR